ncbi:hypothetical protein [Anatilimnocola floriformis]|uniref:hypothetical protein n=1 Tax=Anatilimnocola floriformis TaxID=2948575 RepID=UPI0020C59F02|nr:hypothetical protein [Anatilimnocola floriformis]
MKSPNAAVLSQTAVVRARHAGAAAKRDCRPVDFHITAEEIQNRQTVDYAAGGVVVMFKSHHPISVQQAVTKS